MDKTYLKHVDRIIDLALIEDASNNDITTNCLINPRQKSKAYIIVKEAAVVCGLEIARRVFKKLDKGVVFHTLCKNGDKIKKGKRIALIEGRTRAILTGERIALNFISYLSGVSTTTRAFVEAIKPYKVDILNTRKTTPSLRVLKRHAIKCGGGTPHRMDLNEMVMIKDNHRIACATHGSLDETIHKVKKQTRKKISVEVDNFKELDLAIQADPDIILLDNMTPAQLTKAVKINKKNKGKKKILLEASGGITLKTIRKVAQTGVDRISIGVLTHSHKAIDFSLELLH